MKVQIKGTNDIVELPDNMTKEQMRDILVKRYSTGTPASVNIQDALTPRPSTAEPYEPTLAEKAKQTIADTLYDTGVISDRYGAQRIGQNLTLGLSMLPVLGDAEAGDEFGRAAAKGDGLGMTLASLGVMPFVGDSAKKVLPVANKKFKETFMDFDLYHGTNADIEAFDLSKGGQTSGSDVGKLGVSVTPDYEMAEEFANLATKNGGSPRVIELIHRSKNNGMIELDGTENNHEMAATISNAWDEGYDAIMLKNYTSPSGKKGQRVIIVKDPSQLRKKDAKFDPKEKFNPNLLAGIGGAAIVVGVANEDQNGQ